MEAHQIRNSNSYSLAVQIARAGGIPHLLPIAHDTMEATGALVEQALSCDLILLSGGVSAGKYDVVEPVLAQYGAEFYFDRVLIQPGQPLVFGRIKDRFFFGLPGNPASTMVCFEIFARAAGDAALYTDRDLLRLSLALMPVFALLLVGCVRWLWPLLGGHRAGCGQQPVVRLADRRGWRYVPSAVHPDRETARWSYPPSKGLHPSPGCRSHPSRLRPA